MRSKIVVGILAVVLVSFLAAAFFTQPAEVRRGAPEQRDEVIGVINLNGTITIGENLFSGTGSGSVTEALRQAGQDERIKAVVLRINSPGGSPAAAQEIALEIDRLKEKNKKVVASMGDTAASGGYWVASRADRIIANPGTITGSIGVIMEVQNLEELYDKLGIESEVFKSGPHKDMGSALREVTPAERDIINEMINDIYEQFIEVVAEGRALSLAEVRELADGRVFTGQQAKALGLVDELGNYYDALDTAAELAGLNDPQVEKLDRDLYWRGLFPSLSSLFSSQEIEGIWQLW